MIALRTVVQMMCNGVTNVGNGFTSVEEDWHPTLAWRDAHGDLKLYDLHEDMEKGGKPFLTSFVIPQLIHRATLAVLVISTWAIDLEDLQEVNVRPTLHPRRREEVYVIGVDLLDVMGLWMEIFYDDAGIRRPGTWHESEGLDGDIVEALLTLRQEA